MDYLLVERWVLVLRGLILVGCVLTMVWLMARSVLTIEVLGVDLSDF